MEAKEVTKWQDEKALERFKLISQLIDPDLDPAKRAQLRQAWDTIFRTVP